MTAPTREELLARAEKYITINAPDGRGSALLVMELADALRAGVAQSPCGASAVERFQKRIIDMMQAGCTGFHFATGAQWHSLDIEQKCAAMLKVWDAKSVPLDFKDSHRSPPSNQGASK